MQFLYRTRRGLSGEIVFNTSMIGYQKILTDPSNCGQMMTMKLNIH
ncbi:MAG: carbamoyl-phosphate synthase domain-containing protein [Desulfobacterales bacterium]